MNITPFQVASNFIGLKEIPGDKDNALIVAMLKECNDSFNHDEVPWCSAFVNFICKCLGLPRTNSAAALSWLKVGSASNYPTVGSTIVILKRGTNPNQGHVGFYGGISSGNKVHVLGGNQNNQVCLDDFNVIDVLGYRDLYPTNSQID